MKKYLGLSVLLLSRALNFYVKDILNMLFQDLFLNIF